MCVSVCEHASASAHFRSTYNDIRLSVCQSSSMRKIPIRMVGLWITISVYRLDAFKEKFAMRIKYLLLLLLWMSKKCQSFYCEYNADMILILKFFFPLLFMHTAASVHGVRLCVLCSCVRCMLFFFSCDKLRGKLCNIFCQQHPLASSVSFWCERAHSQCIEKHSLAIDNESEQKMRIYTLYSKWILIYELCIRI